MRTNPHFDIAPLDQTQYQATHSPGPQGALAGDFTTSVDLYVSILNTY
jgi:hypothetical protein